MGRGVFFQNRKHSRQEEGICNLRWLLSDHLDNRLYDIPFESTFNLSLWFTAISGLIFLIRIIPGCSEAEPGYLGRRGRMLGMGDRSGSPEFCRWSPEMLTSKEQLTII